MDLYPAGKLPNSVLSGLLARFGARSRRVLTGPAVGEDAAAIMTSLPCLVAANDPVTCATNRIGWHVVHVNANDVATRGAEPLWFLCTLLLPPAHTDAAMVEQIFEQMAAACREVGAELVGGHTEVTAGLDRPIAVGTMLGEISTFRLTSTRGAVVGDAVLQVGAVAVEGTAILAQDAAERLRASGLAEDVVERAAALMQVLGISILPAARLTMGTTRPHAMHDPTEGGLATALTEVAQAAGVGLEIWADRVLVLAETAEICRALQLDPWGLMASGSLLVCCSQADVQPLLAAYSSAGLAAAHIARVLPAAQGVLVKAADGSTSPLPTFARDELVRALES